MHLKNRVITNLKHTADSQKPRSKDRKLNTKENQPAAEWKRTRKRCKINGKPSLKDNKYNNYLKSQWANCASKCAAPERYRAAESVKKPKQEPMITLPAGDPLQGKGHTWSEVRVTV